MLTKVSIKNFRGLNIETDLKRVNVVVGKNGTGKTNFLEAIYLSSLFYSKYNVHQIQTLILSVFNARGDLQSAYAGIKDSEVTLWDENNELKVIYKRTNPYMLNVLYPSKIVATISIEENEQGTLFPVIMKPKVTVNASAMKQRLASFYISTRFEMLGVPEYIIGYARHGMGIKSNFEVTKDEYERDIVFYSEGDKKIPVYLAGRGVIKEEMIKDSLLIFPLVLIDEFEDSLYPDALVRVLKTIKESKTQVIFTTNSNDVLRIMTEMFSDDEVNLIYLARDGYKIYHKISLFKDFEKPLDWVGYL